MNMLIVFGNIAQTMTFIVDALPAAGESVSCPTYEVLSGGRGGNQSLAAARCGVKTVLVGRVGDDGAGMRILGGLRREGVMTSGVISTPDMPTACVIVLRTKDDQKQIVLAHGAAAMASHEQVPDDILNEKVTVLLQSGLPAEQTLSLAKRAKAKGARTVLSFTPITGITDILKIGLEDIDILHMNRTGATQVMPDTDPLDVARGLSKKYDLTAILTRGKEGSVAILPDGQKLTVSAPDIGEPVDVAGTGDAYCGTLAASLCDNLGLEESLKRASAAASLACTKEGIQDSFPHLYKTIEAAEQLTVETER